MPKILIEISARHVHLTQFDLERLFGDGYKLKKEKDLSQPGQFASTDVVALIGPKRRLDNVRLLGPCRSHTQIEISRTDSYFLGVKAPLRLSGKVIRSGAIKLAGPKGEIDLTEGLIVAKRHIHVNPEQASRFGVSNAQDVKVMIEGPRATVFSNVEIRVDEEFEAAIHLDTDEANAAGIEGEGEGEILK